MGIIVKGILPKIGNVFIYLTGAGMKIKDIQNIDLMASHFCILCIIIEIVH